MEDTSTGESVVTPVAQRRASPDPPPVSETPQTPETPVATSYTDISTAIDATMATLSAQYAAIGYSEEETEARKREVLQLIASTIARVALGVVREKQLMESECAWLRQQIRLLLAMIDDPEGEQLSLVERGVVFDCHQWYEDGIRSQKVYSDETRHDEYLDFDTLVLLDSDDAPVPPPLLLQLKHRLSQAFLTCLHLFVLVFKRVVSAAIAYWDAAGAIEYTPTNPGLAELFSRDDAVAYAEIMAEFDRLFPAFVGGLLAPQTQQHDFVVALPRKALLPVEGPEQLDQFREVNYRLVQIARSVKIAKITTGFIELVQRETQIAQAEVGEREARVDSAIQRCFVVIEELQLLDAQLRTLQQQKLRLPPGSHNPSPHTSLREGTPESETYFDLEMLRFNQANPRQFGLRDEQLAYWDQVATVLEKLAASKRKQRALLEHQCRQLWHKLGEDHGYIEAFMVANALLLDQAMMNFKMEVNRLWQQRLEHIDEFIDATRKDIESACAKLYLSDDERPQLVEMADREQMLKKYEEIVAQLNTEIEAKLEVLGLYSELEQLLADKQFLVDLLKDLLRLLSKNLCKILLEEERTRKRIAKNLPRVVEQLKHAVKQYNDAAGATNHPRFTVGGSDLYEKVVAVEQQVLKRLRAASPARSPQRNRSPVRLASPTRKVSPKRPVLDPLRSSTRALSPLRVTKPAVSRPTKKLPPLNEPLRLNYNQRAPAESLIPQSSPGRPLQAITNLSPRANKPAKVPQLAPMAESTFTDDYESWRQERLKNMRL